MIVTVLQLCLNLKKKKKKNRNVTIASSRIIEEKGDAFVFRIHRFLNYR